MVDMFDKLMKRIEYAKTSVTPQKTLYEVKGSIDMARELYSLTIDEYMVLNGECVANGINNPKYFD